MGDSAHVNRMIADDPLRIANVEPESALNERIGLWSSAENRTAKSA